jgi:hypothetical protein
VDTMTNVVDVYINYLRRKVDLGYDTALIRTIRGVGYQIGENAKGGQFSSARPEVRSFPKLFIIRCLCDGRSGQSIKKRSRWQLLSHCGVLRQ